MCGEKSVFQLVDCCWIGSPPRVRGKDFLPLWGGGKMGDHPRVCGEKYHQSDHTLPHMRITPAYAGKSTSLSATKWQKKDHPRVCGEKMSFRSWIVSGLGSPPRMRGKEEFACSDGSQVGITPAYAGKSREVVCHVCVVTDHPRVCGEKPLARRLWRISKGSPPRMRGKGVSSSLEEGSMRITPAYAGKS